MVVATAGAGKTAALQGVHARTAAPRINFNLKLSRRMRDHTEPQRALQLPRLLAEIVGASEPLPAQARIAQTSCPGFFLFRIDSVHAEGLVAASSRLDLLRHALDDDIVMLQKQWTKGGA
jgi:hypothetical protein